MTAKDVVSKLKQKSIAKEQLKYCVVDDIKHPFKLDKTPAKPNDVNDFIDFDILSQATNLDEFAGVGISIQASNICAIDVDHCFDIPNNVDSGDERAIYFLNLFKDVAYCEFSFSGTGLRILFKTNLIENYSDKYYIKNEKYKVEYYQPSKSFRYVTLTGNSIYDNVISSDNICDKVYEFLNKYMLRPISFHCVNTDDSEETRSYDELMKKVKVAYLKDANFQNLWFTRAPGSGHDESERDYHLVAYLYENITQDKDLIKQIFETSPFFKSKDNKHVYKWTNQEGRYFNYLYTTIRRTR